MSIIEVKKLSKSFVLGTPKKRKKSSQDNFEILDNLNFSINKGESFVIIGPNGSGKSTLLRIMALLEDSNKGEIIFNSQNILKLSKKEKVKIRRQFSFVRQKPVVINDTVRNNIEYPLYFRKISKEKRDERVDSIIKKVGLEEFSEKNARNLSGGEMQRVAIAMNFVSNPSIYIMDEISANLDLKNQKLLEEFIFEIRSDPNKTLILSTHDPFEAIKYADRIAVLNDKHIIQIGTISEIFSAPTDEFTAQFVGYQNVFSGIGEYHESSKITKIKINSLELVSSNVKKGNVKACIRPESIILSQTSIGETSLRNNFKGKITDIKELSHICHIYANSDGESFLISITIKSKKKMNLQVGDVVYFSFKATDVLLL